MSAKIPGTVHLSRAQWRILGAMMQQHLDSSEDASVRGIARIVQSAAHGYAHEPVKRGGRA